jgi:hypothetical protein
MLQSAFLYYPSDNGPGGPQSWSKHGGKETTPTLARNRASDVHPVAIRFADWNMAPHYRKTNFVGMPTNEECNSSYNLVMIRVTLGLHPEWMTAHVIGPIYGIKSDVT